MLLKYILLIFSVLLFAMNMGGSGIAPSFSAVYGAGLISRKKAVVLFGVFVVMGAFALGGRVAKTLGAGLIAKELFTPEVTLIIISSGAISLLIANLLKVPQSTSWVTVAASFGVALHFSNLNWDTAFKMFSLWFILPLIGFVLTYLFFGLIYPPRKSNFWFYEKAHLRHKEIRYFALVASCYVAFAIGANNVANAVGPLTGANLLSPFAGFLLVSPFFGLGGWVIKDRTMKTIGKEIVPLGLITSSLVSFVTASLLIFASFLGFPQSLVQLNTLAIVAVGAIKHEHVWAVRKEVIRKTFLVWLVAPLFSFFAGFLLCEVFL